MISAVLFHTLQQCALAVYEQAAGRAEIQFLLKIAVKGEGSKGNDGFSVVVAAAIELYLIQIVCSKLAFARAWIQYRSLKL